MGIRSHHAVISITVLSVIFLCFLLFPGTVSAVEQEKQGKEEDENKEQKRNGWLALPIVYYTPETKIAVGAGAM